MMPRSFAAPFLAAVLAFAAFPTHGSAATSYSPSGSFETGWKKKSNPNGVWSYGYSPNFTGPITLFDQTVQPGINGPKAQYWISPSVNIGESPSAEFNNGPSYGNGNISFGPHEFLLVSGIGGQYADLVFTAPATATYTVTGRFQGSQYGIGTVVGIVANGAVIFNSSVTYFGQSVKFHQVVPLTAGQTLIFSVGPGGGLQNTGLYLTIQP